VYIERFCRPQKNCSFEVNFLVKVNYIVKGGDQPIFYKVFFPQIYLQDLCQLTCSRSKISMGLPSRQWSYGWLDRMPPGRRVLVNKNMSTFRYTEFILFVAEACRNVRVPVYVKPYLFC
jgi:hypothetical protein